MANISKRQQLLNDIDNQISSLEENIKTLRAMRDKVSPPEKLSISESVSAAIPPKNKVTAPPNFPMPKFPVNVPAALPAVSETVPSDKKTRGRKPATYFVQKLQDDLKLARESRKPQILVDSVKSLPKDSRLKILSLFSSALADDKASRKYVEKNVPQDLLM